MRERSPKVACKMVEQWAKLPPQRSLASWMHTDFNLLKIVHGFS